MLAESATDVYREGPGLDEPLLNGHRQLLAFVKWEKPDALRPGPDARHGKRSGEEGEKKSSPPVGQSGETPTNGGTATADAARPRRFVNVQGAAW